ncbi:T9SS type A sorting domain-containing protein [Hyunsoonleella ulvae]|uniref:T9SS type A sorting domain-containing protein n=1 Tax=Hyunsoonleella ulvae TaxID=2799948 RepID=UPI00193A0DF4|nr:T9SS type A sorting domain-containing protein [Hyunsoonleella ulvae]
MKKILLFTMLFMSYISYTQNQIFVSPSGNNSSGDGSISNPYGTIKHAGDQANPGDTVFVRAGTYQNSDFGDNDIWTGEPVARLSNINGTASDYITFIPYQNEQVIIEFDGIYGFLIQNSSYLKIYNFIFDGIADNITQQEAEDAWGLYKDTNGVIHDLETEMGIDINDPSIIGTSIDQPSSSDGSIEKPIEYNGRALVANKSHHIEFTGNTIRNVPSAAIRAQQSDYITISNNKVYDNTFWTTQGVGAITVSEATVRPLGDTYTGTKIVITQNEVYQNENRLISWNPNKTFVHFEIDEGSGIFLTRNKNTYVHGSMLIANNLSYKNGASGIVCHHTNRATIEHNTVFDNATTNHAKPGGIGVNASDDVKILSNISYSKSNKWALGILAEPVTNLVLDSNIVFNNSGSTNVIRSTTSNPLTSGWNETNPLFIDENNYDFSLSNSSTAIDNASSQSAQTIDYLGNIRDANPDIGAIEYNETLGIENQPTLSILIYPNPVQDLLKVEGLTFLKSEVKIMSTLGQEFQNYNIVNKQYIDLSNLPSGLYIIKIKTFAYKVYKQ